MTECTICLTALGDGTETLNCGHTFHRACMAEWSARSTTCPLCRAGSGDVHIAAFRRRVKAPTISASEIREAMFFGDDSDDEVLTDNMFDYDNPIDEVTYMAEDLFDLRDVWNMARVSAYRARQGWHDVHAEAGLTGRTHRIPKPDGWDVNIHAWIRVGNQGHWHRRYPIDNPDVPRPTRPLSNQLP